MKGIPHYLFWVSRWYVTAVKEGPRLPLSPSLSKARDNRGPEDPRRTGDNMNKEAKKDYDVFFLVVECADVLYRVRFLQRMLESFIRLSWLSLRGDVGALREKWGRGSCRDEGLIGPGEMAWRDGRVRFS